MKLTYVFRKANFARYSFVLIFVFVCQLTVLAQTSAFTYHGRLSDGAMPANGSYTMKFRLYDADTLGNQIGLEQTTLVTVTDGIFTAALDFGASSYPTGSVRWLEVQIEATILTPRQELLSSVYATRAADANKADALSTVCNPCVTNAQIIGVDGAKVSGTVSNATTAGTATTATTAGNVTGIVGVANGGTGSATQNFVDLTTAQSVGGNKTFTGVLSGDGSGLTSVPGTITWQIVTGTSQQAVSNKGYVANNTGEVTITLPATPNIGDVVRVSGYGPGGWKIAQNAGQSIVGRVPSPNLDAWTPHEENRNWSGIASSADGTKLVAIVDNGLIYTSTDSGLSWTPRESSRDWEGVASSADGTKLVAVNNGGQIYTSTDSGVSWIPRENNRNWWGVASSADGTKLVAIDIFGQIYTSTDSGVSWTPRETNRTWWGVASSADGTKLVVVNNGGQIYTSTDSGVSWIPRENNRSWRGIASSADGTKLVANASGGQIYTSTDSGVSWIARENTRNWTGIASSADGTKLVAFVFGEQIYTSADSGVSWTPRENNRNWVEIASSADGTKLVAAIFGGQIYTSLTFGESTTPGTTGFISGRNSEAVELHFMGGGLFIRLTQMGDIKFF